jgi:K+-transporting ATPase KdpF subunit
LGLRSGLREINGGKEMNVLYLITGLITLALFIYLVVALLKPEKFE